MFIAMQDEYESEAHTIKFQHLTFKWTENTQTYKKAKGISNDKSLCGTVYI